MSQYIGKAISLISVTDNRYVGLLEGIDSDKGTVTLQNVRCFGTEGRKNWGPDEIYPNPTVYKIVKFNGNEVKDLSILDVKLEEVQPVLPPQHVLQPPTSAGQQPAQPQQQAQPQVPAAVAGYGVYAPEPSAVPPTSTTTTTTTEVSSAPQRTAATHREEHQTKSRNDDQRRQPSHNRKVEIPKEDFDFQGSNAKFTKDEVHTEEAEPDKPEPNEESHPDQFYNKKSSFFDSISTSTETNTNLRWQEEKAMNLDTFGQASARPRFGRGGQRGGRGGRGRGRGRGGRGGYQNRNNFNQNDNQRGQQPHSQQIEF